MPGPWSTTSRFPIRKPSRRQPSRRLDLEPLTDRSLPSAVPLQVALISDDVEQAAQVRAAAAPGVVSVIYDSATSDLAGLVDRLEDISRAHGGARIGHLGLVAHGRTGAVTIGETDSLDAGDVRADSPTWQRLRGLLTPTARLDLYACDVAAGPAGQAFVRALARRSGADVYASTDRVGTGAAADLTWEYNSAVRARDPLFQPAAMRKIDGLVLEDAFEPNNVRPHADVPPGGNSPNLGLLTSQRTINNLFLAADTDDWFRFDIDGVGTTAHFVQIDSLDPNGDPDLYVYRQDGVEVQRSVHGGQSERVSLHGLAPGSYYILVTPAGTGNTTTNYTLQVVPPAAGTDDAYETNDSQPDADRPTGENSPNLGTLTAPVTLSNLVLRGDEDWFRFDTAGVGTTAHYVRLDGIDTSGDPDLYVYRQDGVEVQRSVHGGFTEQVSLHGLPPGTYYINIVPASAARDSSSQYTLQVVPPAAGTDDAYEINDVKGDADRAPGPGSPNLGTIAGSRLLSNLVLSGDVDWFRFTTTQAGTANHFVRLDGINTSGDPDLYLYRQDGTELQRSVHGGFTEQVTLAARPAGTYYVAVVPNSSVRNSTAQYSLQVAAPGSGISVQAAEVAEGDGGLVNAVFAVTRSDGSLAGSVDFSTADGTAVGGIGAGFDYEPATGTLNFAAGETTKTVTVRVRGDLDDEADETFFLNLSNPSGGALLNESQAIGTIRDDDFGGILQFSAPTFSVAETAVTAFVKVTRTGGTDGTVTVQYTTANGSAADPDDYAATSGALTFGNGETVKTIAIPIVNDDESEGDETVNLILSNPTGGAVLGDLSTSELVILASDRRPGTLQFSAPTFTGSEGSGKATITVTRVNGSDGEVTVRYATANRTARAGLDFTADAGVLTFEDGQTSQTIDIEVVDDGTFEPAELFTLKLSSPIGKARLGVPRTALITIDSDDPLITANAVVAGAGNSGQVKVMDGTTGKLRKTIQAYPVGFKAGVRVATGDVTGDSIPDLVVAPGPGGASTVRVFDGKTGEKLPGTPGEFPHGLPVADGVYVAAGDVDGDLKADIILGAGGSPQVRVFSGLDRAVLSDFQAFPGGNHGVRVAVGDVSGDGAPELVVGAGPGGNGLVSVFTPGGSLLHSITAFDGMTGGVSVAVAGDLTGDGKAEIVVGAGVGAGPHVKVFSAASGTEVLSFDAYGPTFKGGVSVAAGDVDGDGILDLIVAPGAGPAQKVRAFDLATGLPKGKQLSPFGLTTAGVFATGVR
jgi:hypothetical protein